MKQKYLIWKDPMTLESVLYLSVFPQCHCPNIMYEQSVCKVPTPSHLSQSEKGLR